MKSGTKVPYCQWLAEFGCRGLGPRLPAARQVRGPAQECAPHAGGLPLPQRVYPNHRRKGKEIGVLYCNNTLKLHKK